MRDSSFAGEGEAVCWSEGGDWINWRQLAERQAARLTKQLATRIQLVARLPAQLRTLLQAQMAEHRAARARGQMFLQAMELPVRELPWRN